MRRDVFSPTCRPCLWLFRFHQRPQGNGNGPRRASAPCTALRVGRPGAEVTASALGGVQERFPHPEGAPLALRPRLGGSPRRSRGSRRGASEDRTARKPGRPRPCPPGGPRSPAPHLRRRLRCTGSCGAGGPPRARYVAGVTRWRAQPTQPAAQGGPRGAAPRGLTFGPWGPRTLSPPAGLCAGKAGLRDAFCAGVGRLGGQVLAPRNAGHSPGLRLGGEVGGGEAESFLP